jgi:hypothetical protein
MAAVERKMNEKSEFLMKNAWIKQSIKRSFLRCSLSFAASQSATLGDEISDDPIRATTVMDDITSHFWCRLAQADVFCARDADVFQMLRQRGNSNAARYQDHSSRSYGDLVSNVRTEPHVMA